MNIVICEYETYSENEILPLYESVGWTAYTRTPELLRRAFEKSLLALGAYDGEKLVGILRAVGDGCTVVFVQDLLVHPNYRRKGIGSALLKAARERFTVRQLQLTCDSSPELISFYESVGFRKLSMLGMTGFMA